MATLPESAANSYNADTVNYPSDTWVICDERIGAVTTGLQVMKQAIEIMLNTERFKYPVCSTNYGVELTDLIGKDREYVESMMKRRITEALAVDHRVLSINDFTFESVNGSIICTFTVNTVFGEITEEVDLIG